MKKYSLNHIDHQIIVTKSFMKAAGIVGSTDYNEMLRLRREMPDYEIVDASDMMDALYYASEYREAALADQEKYLNWLMNDEEYGYFLDRMTGDIECKISENK